MSILTKNRARILEKLKIETLNPMQLEAVHAIETQDDIVLLSPTGTGKTLAFLLPIIERLDSRSTEVQALIIVPTRELAIQIEQVARAMGAGFKVNSIYGGRAGSQDKIDLKHRPAILIGTPGRVADHLRKESFSTSEIQILVLDEFDKSLEIGYETEMMAIVDELPNIKKRILTSATVKLDVPAFIGLQNPVYIDYLHETIDLLQVKIVLSDKKEKLDTLVQLISHIGNQPGIIFCNFRETIEYVSARLTEERIGHGCFHGGMEQRDRELELLKFRNGTHQIIVATDLAARGLDIPEIRFIIHFQLPQRSREFTHRNGRTARMNQDGTAYVLKWTQENLPEFIQNAQTDAIGKGAIPKTSPWKTLHISGGRRDKISKGDIAGFFIKQAELKSEDIGIIEIKQDCAYIAVKAEKLERIIEKTNNSKLKKTKIRVSSI